VLFPYCPDISICSMGCEKIVDARNVVLSLLKKVSLPVQSFTP